MKLLFDENLSPKLPELLADVYPESTHVHSCGLGSADDSEVWNYARDNNFSIVSKDSDFEERAVLFGVPPKVIRLRVPNCSSEAIEILLRNARSAILAFIEDTQESCLVLGFGSR